MQITCDKEWFTRYCYYYLVAIFRFLEHSTDRENAFKCEEILLQVNSNVQFLILLPKQLSEM